MSNIICFLLGFGICYFLACFVIFFENQYNMSQPRLWFARPWGIFMLIICFIPTLHHIINVSTVLKYIVLQGL